MSAAARKDHSNAVSQPMSNHLDEDYFQRIALLIHETAGIKLGQQKRMMVEGRLRKRMRESGAESANDYCRYIFEEGGLNDELPHLVDVMTTNKTDFFRERDHFELLESRMIPELLKRRNAPKPLVKVWSAASSNGSEAFTLAMVLHDLLARGRPFEFAILGTDISASILKVARRAVYPVDAVEPVPAPLRSKYTMVGLAGRQSGCIRIAPELRRMVNFEHLNLMDASYPYDRDVDIVFLRNVLIYFERQDQEAVVEKLVDHVRPGGFFVVGHSESMVVVDPRLNQIAPAVFQRAK